MKIFTALLGHPVQNNFYRNELQAPFLPYFDTQHSIKGKNHSVGGTAQRPAPQRVNIVQSEFFQATYFSETCESCYKLPSNMHMMTLHCMIKILRPYFTIHFVPDPLSLLIQSLHLFKQNNALPLTQTTSVFVVFISFLLLERGIRSIHSDPESESLDSGLLT